MRDGVTAIPRYVPRSAQLAPERGQTCTRCGDLAPWDSVYCCECGTRLGIAPVPALQSAPWERMGNGSRESRHK